MEQISHRMIIESIFNLFLFISVLVVFILWFRDTFVIVRSNNTDVKSKKLPSNDEIVKAVYEHEMARIRREESKEDHSSVSKCTSEESKENHNSVCECVPENSNKQVNSHPQNASKTDTSSKKPPSNWGEFYEVIVEYELARFERENAKEAYHPRDVRECTPERLVKKDLFWDNEYLLEPVQCEATENTEKRFPCF